MFIDKIKYTVHMVADMIVALQWDLFCTRELV